jgi:hypothetical protein
MENDANDTHICPSSFVPRENSLGRLESSWAGCRNEHWSWKVEGIVVGKDCNPTSSMSGAYLSQSEHCNSPRSPPRFNNLKQSASKAYTYTITNLQTSLWASLRAPKCFTLKPYQKSANSNTHDTRIDAETSHSSTMISAFQFLRSPLRTKLSIT